MLTVLIFATLSALLHILLHGFVFREVAITATIGAISGLCTARWLTLRYLRLARVLISSRPKIRILKREGGEFITYSPNTILGDGIAKKTKWNRLVHFTTIDGKKHVLDSTNTSVHQSETSDASIRVEALYLPKPLWYFGNPFPIRRDYKFYLPSKSIIPIS